MKTVNLPGTTDSNIKSYPDNPVISDDATKSKRNSTLSIARIKRAPTPVLTQINPMHINLNQSHIISMNNKRASSRISSENNTVSINFISRFFRRISQNKWKELHAPAVMQRNIKRSGNLLKEIKKKIGGEVFANTSVGFNINRKDIIQGCLTFLAQQESAFAKIQASNRSKTVEPLYYNQLLNNQTHLFSQIYAGDYIDHTSQLNIRAFSQLPNSIKDKFSTISDDLLYYGNNTDHRLKGKARLEPTDKKKMLSILLNHISYQIKISRDSLNNTKNTTHEHSEKTKIAKLIAYQIEVITEFYVSHLNLKKKKPGQKNSISWIRLP